jgi:hypothetical protein
MFILQNLEKKSRFVNENYLKDISTKGKELDFEKGNRENNFFAFSEMKREN